ncbi:MAG: hypothetical protein ABI140_16925 [Jatrophihabitantaceae bacterium]
MSLTATGTDAAGSAETRRARPDLRPLALLLAAQLVVGALIGLGWRLWSPSSVSYLLSDGNGGSLVVPDESEAQIAGDGRFVVLSVLAGLLFGLIAWRLRRHRGPLTLGVLGVGSVLSSLIALGVGELLAGGSNHAAINTAFHPKLALHAEAALWLQALFAVLLYTVLIGLAADPELGRLSSQAEPANWTEPPAGWPVPPANPNEPRGEPQAGQPAG